MTKRLCSLLLALVLVLSLAPMSFASAEDAYDFTVMLPTSSADASTFPITQLFEEKTGYKVDYLEVSPAAAAEQTQLMWMSGDYPDVIVTSGLGTSLGITDNDIYRYAGEGIIVDLAPYLTNPEIMPNFNKYMRDFEWDLLKDSEGRIYGFPIMMESMIDRGLAINKVWLDKLGLAVPETPEELMNAWKAFKDGDPNGNGLADEIPFSTELVWNNALETLNPMFGMFGTSGGWQVDNEGKVFFGQTTEDYKEGIKWFREAYAAGLLDAEIFTQDMTSYKAKAQSKPLILGSTLAFVYSAYTRSFTEDTYQEYVQLLPMKNEAGERIWWSPSDAATTITHGMLVTSACEDVEAVCRWADCMYDIQMAYKIDGSPISFKYNEEDGSFVFEDKAPEGWDAYADWRAANHTNGFPRNITYYAAELGNCEQYIAENIIEVAHREKNKLYRENCVLTNYLDMDTATEEEAEIEGAYFSELDTYWKNTIASWITGNGDVDAEWDSFISGMKAMGLDEIQAVYQARYDRKAK